MVIFNIKKISNNNEIILIGADEKQLKSFEDKGFKIKDSFNNCYYILKFLKFYLYFYNYFF